MAEGEGGGTGRGFGGEEGICGYWFTELHAGQEQEEEQCLKRFVHELQQSYKVECVAITSKQFQSI